MFILFYTWRRLKKSRILILTRFSILKFKFNVVYFATPTFKLFYIPHSKLCLVIAKESQRQIVYRSKMLSKTIVKTPNYYQLSTIYTLLFNVFKFSYFMFSLSIHC